MKIINESIKKDYPNYKIINISEFGIPIHHKEVICLLTINKRIPILLEFTLKLLHQEISLQDICRLLAIDENLIKKAYYDLDFFGFYDISRKRVTDEGRRYIYENKYDALEKYTLNISVDGFTGEVTKKIIATSNRNAKKINLKTLKPLIDKNNLSTIQTSQIKEILDETQMKSGTDTKGELVEIVKIQNYSSSEYKRVHFCVIESIEGKQKIVIYDRNNRRKDYEEKLNIADESGILFYDKKELENYSKLIIESTINAKYEKTDIIEDIFDLNHLKKEVKVLNYSIPFFDFYSINKEWISTLNDFITHIGKVEIKFTGDKYPNENFKNLAADLVDMSKKNSNLSINHSLHIEHASIIFDNSYGFENRLEPYQLHLKHNTVCPYNNTYKFSSVEIENKDETNEVDSGLKYRDKHALKKDLLELISVIKMLDSEIEDHTGIPWLIKGVIHGESEILNTKVTSSKDQFATFAKNLNMAIYECLESHGHNNGMRNYFHEEFKKDFPELYNAINRNRLYRNYYEHRDLTDLNHNRFLEYVKLDTNGRFPELFEGGFKVVQYIIITELLKAIKITGEEIRSFSVY
ncbi:hypothetical protein [Planococcus soli]|uniref:hypothetical protein n=1 Tax=Planococcus soli TaxID=2666072 RepID=UPI00115D118A|nr:hypothetical protein [Planococcus soli]